MPADRIQEYRSALAASTPTFLLPRRFISAEGWTKATTQDGIRYLGLFREHEPDLASILTHPKLLILGEPGAGKSTTGRAVVQHLKSGLKKACMRAGLKGITWHTFRHTFASRLTRSGVDIVTVKELLGHSTIVVTMRYAHSNDETKRRAVGRLSTSDKPVTVGPAEPKTAVFYQ